jgi:cytochrome c553
MAALRSARPVALAVLAVATVALASAAARADMWDDSGSDPWDHCAECHGLDGAGNHIKFPRLAGQKPDYIVKQLHDFRDGKRANDGGQMHKTATEVDAADYPRVAEWFVGQRPAWPKPTIDGEPDFARARQLADKGDGQTDGCLSCHSAAGFNADDPKLTPRIAGQRDWYLAKELFDYRDGRRGAPGDVMVKIARRLSDGDIRSLAIYLSQNPNLD